MSQKTALIAGATGAASIRLVEVLIADPEWSVIGLSRNPPSSAHDRLTYIGADLMDAAGTRATLAPHGQVTHAFYTSRVFSSYLMEAVQMVSALLREGAGYLKAIREELSHWLEEHEYESLQQMCGNMSLLRCPDPKSFHRGNYMRVLQGWKL